MPYLPNTSGELEVCIDLIKKNLPHNKIHVVTEPINKNLSEKPHVNQIKKLKWAIENLDISEDFFWWNDDIFLCEPVKEIPYYHYGSLAGHHNKTKWLPQKKAMKTTLDMFPDGLSYELHVPIKFNKNKTYRLLKELESLPPHKYPLIRSFYGNTYKVGGKYIDDVKNVKDYEGKTFLSTDEKSYIRDIGKYVRSRL